MTKVYCTVCLKGFTAQRSTAKYCCEACKQRAKYKRQLGIETSDFEDDLLATQSKINHLLQVYFDDKHNPDALIGAREHIDNIRYVLNKIEANIAVIEIERQNTWYQCNNCGQKTFGYPDKCDFCSESDFKRIKVV